MDINYKIPKVCPCGWNYFDSIPNNHIHSNKHNFALLEQRKAVQKTSDKSTKGDCEICKVKNMKNLERHNLTNSHIMKNDMITTYEYIWEKYKSYKSNEADKNSGVDAKRQEDDGSI